MEEVIITDSLSSRSKPAFEILDNAPIGILVFSADWKVEFVSDSFNKLALYYNLEFQDLQGNNILKTPLFPGIALSPDLLELSKGVPFELELRNIKVPDRGNISLYLKASPVMEEGVFRWGILTLEDVATSAFVIRETEFKADAFEQLFSHLDDILLITNPAGEILYSYGSRLKELKILNNTSAGNSLFPLRENYFKELLQAVIKKREVKETLLELYPGAEQSYFNCRMAPYINQRGHVPFVFLLLRDITAAVVEKQKLENEVKELNQYLQISNALSDSIIAADTSGNIISVNKAAEKLFGISDAGVTGMFAGNLFTGFEEVDYEKIIERLQTGKPYKKFIPAKDRNGNEEITEAVFNISGGRNPFIIIRCTVITEEYLRIKKREEAEERQKTIILNARELICNINPAGVVQFANNTFLDTLKYSDEEINGKNFKELIDPDYFKANILEFKSFQSTSNEIELPLLTKKGYPVFVLASFVPVSTGTNELKYYNVYMTDITDKKVSEKDLMIFRSMFESSQDGIVVQSDGKIILANKSFAEIFGYLNAESITGKMMLDLISNNDTVRVAEYLKTVELKKQAPGRLECLGRRLDGSNFYIEVSAATFESGKKTFLVLITREITERKRAQQVIRESEEKYRNITENIDDFLYTYEKSGKTFRPTFYTSSVEKITGYSQVEFLLDTKLVLKIIHPDDFSIIKKKLKNIFRSRIQLSEEFEFRIINKHGNIVWVRNKINLSRNSEGKVVKIYGLVSDTSLRKKAEEELTKSTENLVKLNETKDKFISIISHDLRTPFTSILGFTDLLLSDEGLSEQERKQYVKFIRESSLSMLSLVNSLLDWTRLQTGRIKFEPEKNDIRGVIESSINSLSGAAFQKNISLVSEVDQEVSVLTDKNLMMQVFNNLISNAIKFTRQGGTITISAEPSARIRFYEFTVKDNGVGIKPENLSNLFRVDAKFTSEGTAGEKGSGLGLSLVKEIIEKHEGYIWVNSVYGEGTEFKFLLPVASANILLVDDSKTDRLLYSKILKSITPDYNIDIAANGREAMEKIKEAPPALVISDHLMPEMNGYDFVITLNKSEIKGKPPVIILSSELDRSTIYDYNQLGIEYVFSKPVNLSTFKQAVERSLKKGLTG